MAKTKQIKKGAEDRNVRKEDLRTFGRRNMTTYATEVNLSRSVPDLYDGLKPVQRRILWGASEQTTVDSKTARIVGDVIGKYHPHGDGSVADAIETMVTSAPTPLMFGRGNWGGIVDGAAAMRYTNCGLTHYARLIFNDDYMKSAAVTYVPNYDGRDVEPVTLPMPLPHVLMAGSSGTGVGMTTLLPSFTPDSLLVVLRRMLKGEKTTREDFAKILKINFRWGGVRVKSKANRAEWEKMFFDSEAKVLFEAELEVDRPHKTIIMRQWPDGLKPEDFVDAVRAMPETKKCENVEDDITFRIECRSDYNYDQFDAFVEKVRKVTRKSKAFKINVTKRSATVADGVVSYQTEMLALPVPELLQMWLKERIQVELKSLAYRIEKQAKAIHHTKLLIFACDHLDIIFKGLRRKDTEEFLVKQLKRPLADVKIILDLKVRQLSALDHQKLKDKLKEQEQTMKQLEKWQAKPKTKVLLDLDEVEEALAKDAADKKKRDLAELKMLKG